MNAVQGQRGPKRGFPTLRCDAPGGGWRCDAATLRRVPALVQQLSKLFESGCLGKPKVSYDIQVQFRLTISGSDLLGLDFLGSGKAT